MKFDEVVKRTKSKPDGLLKKPVAIHKSQIM